MEKHFIWSGVFNSFQECPVTGKGFNGSLWAERSLDEVKEFLNRGYKNPENVLLRRNRDNYLPFLISSLMPSVSSIPQENLQVLDFGGGLGFTYAAMLKKIPSSDFVDFTIVETAPICEVGNSFFGSNKNISFIESIDNLRPNRKFDIIHFGSCLQYIENWKALLIKMKSFNPKYFLFTGLLAGNVPDFVTLQNYHDSKIPVWFLNLQDFISFLSEQGFDHVFQSDYFSTYFGIEQNMPMENFPEDKRLQRPINLLFKGKKND